MFETDKDNSLITILKVFYKKRNVINEELSKAN